MKLVRYLLEGQDLNDFELEGRDQQGAEKILKREAFAGLDTCYRWIVSVSTYHSKLQDRRRDQ